MWSISLVDGESGGDLSPSARASTRGDSLMARRVGVVLSTLRSRPNRVYCASLLLVPFNIISMGAEGEVGTSCSVRYTLATSDFRRMC